MRHGYAGLYFFRASEGKRGDARERGFSLGIMFYEMLTGKVPFTG